MKTQTVTKIICSTPRGIFCALLESSKIHDWVLTNLTTNQQIFFNKKDAAINYIKDIEAGKMSFGEY